MTETLKDVGQHIGTYGNGHYRLQFTMMVESL